VTLNVKINETKECSQCYATDKHIESLNFPKKGITREWLIIIYIGKLKKVEEIKSENPYQIDE